MQIPSQFEIFGTTFKVKQPNKVVINGESVLGYCDSDNAIIYLRRNLKRDLKEVVFWHECIHAILFSLEYTKLAKDENFVERVSKVLHQLIKTCK